MSTRCNILIKGGKNPPVLLYRHCDGYPEETGVELKRLVEKYTSENQYCKIPCVFATNLIRYRYKVNPNMVWACAKTDGYVMPYDLADAVQSDIDYLYFIDLKQKSVRCCRANSEIWKIGENFRIEYFEKYRELEVPIPDDCDKS